MESVAARLGGRAVDHEAMAASVAGGDPLLDERVRAAVALMCDRLGDPLSVAEIAGDVHLSVYHFIRVFKEKTGETLHRFLGGLRIEEARRLLRGTDLPIARIAERCGFATPGALSAAFLRHTGSRPSEYRNS
ncbi:helix-turn-helix domain-containing protein [Amycolatopsis sp. WAC 01376]|uniref:helix-turn-helix domain-containing protein n=1 Tax=Amycolatopsis sp. WAC 01376 TaxID=2203195 RepID=UPI001F22BDAE|nr:AraC family transcriptional regulator [Amycolatopsis sp. WAC 01376]